MTRNIRGVLCRIENGKMICTVPDNWRGFDFQRWLGDNKDEITSFEESASETADEPD